jgi:hypothetical protein
MTLECQVVGSGLRRMMLIRYSSSHRRGYVKGGWMGHFVETAQTSIVSAVHRDSIRKCEKRYDRPTQ